MKKEESIRKYMKNHPTFTVPEIQSLFSCSYSEAREMFRTLESKNMIFQSGDLDFSWWENTGGKQALDLPPRLIELREKVLKADLPIDPVIVVQFCAKTKVIRCSDLVKRFRVGYACASKIRLFLNEIGVLEESDSGEYACRITYSEFVAMFGESVKNDEEERELEGSCVPDFSQRASIGLNMAEKLCCGSGGTSASKPGRKPENDIDKEDDDFNNRTYDISENDPDDETTDGSEEDSDNSSALSRLTLFEETLELFDFFDLKNKEEDIFDFAQTEIDTLYEEVMGMTVEESFRGSMLETTIRGAKGLRRKKLLVKKLQDELKEIRIIKKALDDLPNGNQDTIADSILKRSIELKNKKSALEERLQLEKVAQNVQKMDDNKIAELRKQLCKKD